MNEPEDPSYLITCSKCGQTKMVLWKYLLVGDWDVYICPGCRENGEEYETFGKV